ncbi:MAG: 30S ribosomal protein S12 methylthiotransferase RimO [Ignavibacteriaceae bacterium]
MASGKRKINVITLGCSKNTVDSERLMNQLKVNNLKLVDNPDDADTVIINTCGFIEAAKVESINTILNSVALKQQGKLKEVIVTGCLSARYKDELHKNIPEVDRYFGTEDYENVLRHFGANLKYELLGERILSYPSHTAYLKISEGCDRPCSFCAIPLMRGSHRSKPMDELVSESKFLAANGTKELILIAQDTTDYGTDIYGKQKLADLLNRLSEIDSIEWIRLMYAYPSRFPDDVINVIANNPKICKYIDMPLQHISDNVLKSMRRGISKSGTLRLIDKLKNRIDGLTLRTTFMVGYPNETSKDFEELCRFVEETRFNRLGVFTYSQEENTPAYILGDPVPAKEKQSRKNIIMEIQREISRSLNQSLIGKEERVIIDGTEGNYYIARSCRDAPEVDGEILIERNGSAPETGIFRKVKITDFEDYDLFALFSDL